MLGRARSPVIFAVAADEIAPIPRTTVLPDEWLERTRWEAGIPTNFAKVPIHAVDFELTAKVVGACEITTPIIRTRNWISVDVGWTSHLLTHRVGHFDLEDNLG
ncbi:MAG: hypothetical protein ACK5QX_12000, partial [bacterium]